MDTAFIPHAMQCHNRSYSHDLKLGCSVIKYNHHAATFSFSFCFATAATAPVLNFLTITSPENPNWFNFLESSALSKTSTAAPSSNATSSSSTAALPPASIRTLMLRSTPSFSTVLTNSSERSTLSRCSEVACTPNARRLLRQGEEACAQLGSPRWRAAARTPSFAVRSSGEATRKSEAARRPTRVASRVSSRLVPLYSTVAGRPPSPSGSGRPIVSAWRPTAFRAW
mmetsp:Transcript_15251/g.34167  ORF Transcript_15251/g.34167 Transcript_15251/m.34167 type:complete len:227 (-) Transcript_15251:650-1330(-)